MSNITHVGIQGEISAVVVLYMKWYYKVWLAKTKKSSIFEHIAKYLKYGSGVLRNCTRNKSGGNLVQSKKF